MGEYISPYSDTIILQKDALNKLLSNVKAYPTAGQKTGIRLIPNKDGSRLQIQNTRKVSLIKSDDGGYLLKIEDKTDEANGETNITLPINKKISIWSGQPTGEQSGYFNYNNGDQDYKIRISGFNEQSMLQLRKLYVSNSLYNTSATPTQLSSGQLDLIPSTNDYGKINFFSAPLLTDNASQSADVQLICKEKGFLNCSGKIRGAVWNDYAEYRESLAKEPGRCVIETGFGDLELSTARLQLGGNIISDTFGFSIGKTNKAQTPIAVAGRVLAYPLEDRYDFTAGAAVCSGPNGTVSLMTREEIREWPDAIIGYVSEIPEYETWGEDNIAVNGRIWIKLR